MKLTITYIILAVIATAANIGAQDVSIRFYTGPHAVLVSVIVGTGVGLVMKYILDKKYIFQFVAKDAAHDMRTFLLYSLMGVATTFIFWGFEFGFHFLFETKGMRYFGGIVGLGIGYWVKYRLDKRFVFQGEMVQGAR